MSLSSDCGISEDRSRELAMMIAEAQLNRDLNGNFLLDDLMHIREQLSENEIIWVIAMLMAAVRLVYE